MESRIEELECKLMAAEDLLESLNVIVYRQQQALDVLQSQMREMRRQMQNSQRHTPLRPEDEIPPHY